MIKKSVFGKEIYEYTGVIHIHTEHSFDGHGTLQEIVEIAQQEHIDFLIITDHRNIDVKKELSLLLPHNVIPIIGYEMNDANKNNHYLIFDIDEVYPLTMTVEEYVSKTREQGGIGFIAHPFEKRKSRRTLRTYVWTDWSVMEFDGMEIWNYISEWTDKLRIPLNVIPKILFPDTSISRPNKQTVRKWDELNNNGRRIPAIGSVDSHQNKYSFGPFSISFLPHKKLFKTIRTNIQTREPISDKKPEQAILSKLKAGNSYVVNYTHADPYMFYCGIESKITENFALPGEEISISERELYLYIYLQQDCHVKIIHNGKVVHTEYRNKISYPIKEKGLYRIEVFIGLKGWLFSNPMYVV
ncbi:MAG: CehA/McbA family metallohydrolase [Candidatus Cloacimonetes bacterium]|nr:CehA/McbA family metallohydrolase [Candidatus Cloacimonadota bacterium]